MADLEEDLSISAIPDIDDDDDLSDLSDVDEAQFADIDVNQIGEQYVEEEEEDIIKLPSFKRRKTAAEAEKAEKKGKVRPVKRLRQRAETGTIEDEEVEEERRPTDPAMARKWDLDRQLDMALKPQKKRRVARGEEDLEAKADEEIVDLRVRMENAAREDFEANYNKLPSTSKLKLLPEVENMLNKNWLNDAVLDNNLLGAMKAWLEPLPDKSLPAYNIQKVIFTALQKLPIQTEHLRESGIGKIVYFYQLCKHAEPTIRRAAQKLVADWTRPIIKRSNKYRDQEVESVDYIASQGTQRQRVQYQDESGSQKTRVPTRDMKIYTVAPRSMVRDSQDAHAAAKQAGNEKFRKMMQAMAAKKAKR
ncbi:Transcription factor iws1 [Saitoella coloradoensis]